jgi:pimeloyl-ACP methyl ester carboxylesterase
MSGRSIQALAAVCLCIAIPAAGVAQTQPVIITFDDINNVPLNLEKVQMFTSKNVEFRGGALWRNSNGESWYRGFGRNAIDMTFPAGATDISFQVSGYGRSIRAETLPLEVRDGNVGTGKLIAVVPIHPLDTPLYPPNHTIEVAEAGTGRITIFTAKGSAGFPPSDTNQIVIDNVRYTPFSAGDQVPPAPIFASKRPDARDDTRVIVDHGPQLDTRCSFHGSLTIDIPVRRVVGAVDALGRLLDAPHLIRNGHLSKTARISVMAYDIDPKEIDEVYFNGQKIGTLQGAHGQWTKNTFSVPIDSVRFGRNANGVNAEAANTLRIDIDTARRPSEPWCTAIDWVQLDFAATAPIFLVHGTNVGPSTWEGGFVDHLDSLGIPYSNKIKLEANGSIENNGEELRDALRRLMHAFGAKKCHLVAHSKGGNDSREYLTKHMPTESEIEVLSLYTLGTPFQGTVLSDITALSRDTPGSRSSNLAIALLIDLDFWFIPTPCCEALDENRTGFMSNYNASHPFVAPVRFYNFGADADVDDDGKISEAERLTTFVDIVLPNSWVVILANAMHDILGTVRRVRQVDHPIRDSTGYVVATVPMIEVVAANSNFVENDLVVTVPSSQHPSATFLGTIGANHSTLKSSDVAQGILSRIAADFPIKEP